MYPARPICPGLFLLPARFAARKPKHLQLQAQFRPSFVPFPFAQSCPTITIARHRTPHGL